MVKQIIPIIYMLSLLAVLYQPNRLTLSLFLIATILSFINDHAKKQSEHSQQTRHLHA
ncbi:MAG: hypothetical protein ABF586_12935 [Sporolactobacillus sp.]